MLEGGLALARPSKTSEVKLEICTGPAAVVTVTALMRINSYVKIAHPEYTADDLAVELGAKFASRSALLLIRVSTPCVSGSERLRATRLTANTIWL